VSETADMVGEITARSNGSAPGQAWLLDAAELLSRPDPGPTPWLVQDLIVDQAIIAAVGRWKTTKSYALLDICISIATGEPAFGRLEIPQPGPVVYVCEESGQAALWRRLDALCRGRAIDPERLRERLHVAANARIKLDDPVWQAELVTTGQSLRPRLFVFDPLARMKAPARKENDQPDMAVPIEFLRLLRDETKAGSCFVHHTGHLGEHMRGTSDLESVWETKLVWKRDGQAALVTIESEHREAEAGEPVRYRVSWDHDTRTMRFPLVEQDGLPPLEQRILGWLRDHADQRTDDIAKGLEMRVSDVRETLRRLEETGPCHSGPSGRRDAMGRAIRDKVWNLSETHSLTLDVARPNVGPTQAEAGAEHRGSVARPNYVVVGGTAEPPDEPLDDDEESPSWTEWEQALQRLQERDGIRMRTFAEVHAEIERMHAALVDADPGASNEPPLWDDDDADALADPDAYAFVTPIDDESEPA
jgi:hypothetical protein